jgi:hypothetical protein
VIAVVSQEQRAEAHFARNSLDAAVLANAGILLLVILTLGFTAGDRQGNATSSLVLARDLSVGLAVGGTLGVLAAFGSRTIPASLHAALAVVAFLFLEQKLVHAEAAIMAGSFLAGVVVAHAGRDRPVARDLPMAVPVISAALFVVAGALADIHLVIAMAAPAALVFLVRAASLWLGSRLAGGLAGDAVVRRLGFAPLLPQAGFSLAIIGVLDGPHGLSTTLVSLIIAVVVINELAMPPVLRIALRASDRDQATSAA